MSGKLNKKNVIAIVAIAVLAIIAITGTVVFLKTRGTAEATEIAAERGNDRALDTQTSGQPGTRNARK